MEILKPNIAAWCGRYTCCVVAAPGFSRDFKKQHNAVRCGHYGKHNIVAALADVVCNLKLYVYIFWAVVSERIRVMVMHWVL